MKGRGTIHIPLEHIVGISEDIKRDVLEIVLKGNSYPGWYPGMDPMVFIGAYNLDDEEFIHALVHYTSTGAWPGVEKLEPMRKALRGLFDKSDVDDGNHMEYEAAEQALDGCS